MFCWGDRSASFTSHRSYCVAAETVVQSTGKSNFNDRAWIDIAFYYNYSASTATLARPFGNAAASAYALIMRASPDDAAAVRSVLREPTLEHDPDANI